MESSQSPRRNLSVKSCITHYGNFSTTHSFEREPSHSTLYELVELPSANKNQHSQATAAQQQSQYHSKNSNIICKYSTHMKPIHSVQFDNNQLTLAETCISNNKLRIHNNGNNRIPIRISSLRRETKTAQTLSMVVGGFIACWLPFFIYYLLMPFLPKESVSNVLMEFLTWLGWINSAINPFIYAFYNADFRIAFWRLTFRKFCKNNKHNLSLLKN